MRKVSAADVVDEPTLLRKIRKVVATPVVGAVATDINLTRCTKLPLAPEVNALKMSVPTVPPPADDVFAAVWVIVTELTFGVPLKIGDVLAMIYLTSGNWSVESSAPSQTLPNLPGQLR